MDQCAPVRFGESVQESCYLYHYRPLGSNDELQPDCCSSGSPCNKAISQQNAPSCCGSAKFGIYADGEVELPHPAGQEMRPDAKHHDRRDKSNHLVKEPPKFP